MTLKVCLALIGSLIASFILIDCGASGSNVDATGVLPMSSSRSASAQIGTAGLAYTSDCSAPRFMGGQFVALTNGAGAGHRFVGASRARQINCARG